jgi:hypothetical protein
VENRGYGVRVFTTTRKLIYSSWTDTPFGPQFDDGTAQTFDQFLAGQAAPFALPDEVLSEIRALIQLSSKKGFLRR